jgi:hypothetical protein
MFMMFYVSGTPRIFNNTRRCNNVRFTGTVAAHAVALSSGVTEASVPAVADHHMEKRESSSDVPWSLWWQDCKVTYVSG